ncbi:MAG: LLM class flavin-dependent oxidoreductase [Anaerolineaceae bacterium]|nr:LLM class flavin-dependent oxidoreductase [Anaerolineaceae bacterium]
MKVGIKTGQGGYSYNELSQIWQKSDALGFESAWLYDHFIALGNSEADCLESYATLSALARDTKQIRLGVMVTCTSYRNPALLAKITSTVDQISNGRLVLGLGAGWYENEFKSYGYEYLSNAERIEQLRETIQIVRAMWSEERATFHGKHYHIDQAINLPKPVQMYPQILVGITHGTRVMPRVAVKDADGFNSVSSVEDLALWKQIVESAERERQKIGRGRSQVTYSLQASILTGTQSDIQEIASQQAAKAGTSATNYLDSLRKRGALIGKPAEVADKLAGFVENGLDYLMIAAVGDKLGWPLDIIKNDLLPLLQ